MSDEAAAAAAIGAARTSYGRLLAILVARTRDIAAAEDALSDAFVAALDTWPRDGIPRSPDAWLLTAARNRLTNTARHRAVEEAAALDLAVLADESAPEADTLPDERLKLLFACAHPALDAAIRTPLMLQVVLGLNAAQVAAAFLVEPAAMGQRLSRAKAKIRDAGLRFELPTAEDMPARLDDVLEAVYAAYGTSWESVDGAESATHELAGEAVFLARLIVALMPGQPEPQGLLALMLYCESRRAARRDADGDFVPLDRQDTRLWSRDLIIEAEGLLTAASRHGRFGRFQCEAAIQSVHAQRPLTGRVNHQALVTLYALLVERCPSLGASVGLAAVLFDSGRAEEALPCLDRLDSKDVQRYQPYWVTRARVLAALGHADASAEAMARALSLTEDPAIRRFLAGS